jgi:PAS domain S-box-containing protein
VDAIALRHAVRQTSFAVLLDAFPYAATLTNASDQFVYANSAFSEKYGWSEEEIIGLKPSLLLPLSFITATLAPIRKEIEGSKLSWCGMIQNQHKNGSLFTIELMTFQIKMVAPLSPSLFLGISSPVGAISNALSELISSFCRVMFETPSPPKEELGVLRKHEQIIRLRQFGYSLKEIAGFLGVDINTPNVVLHRARRKKM